MNQSVLCFIQGLIAGIGLTCMFLMYYRRAKEPTCTCGSSPDSMCNICSVKSKESGNIYKLTKDQMKSLNRKFNWKD
jgi:hypothetical protein